MVMGSLKRGEAGVQGREGSGYSNWRKEEGERGNRDGRSGERGLILKEEVSERVLELGWISEGVATSAALKLERK
jgi:hypothetical protein